MPAAARYNKRGAPGDYSKGWLDSELGNIQRAMASTQTGVAAAVAPIVYDPTTETVSHDASGVAPGTYGDGSHVAAVQVDATGHVVSASSVPIAAEANTASNVGSGAGLFKAKTGADLAFRSIAGGPGVAITNLDANTLQIGVTAGASIIGRARRTSDVSNNTGAFISSALNFPVVLGDSWSVRWVLWVASGSTHTGGITIEFTFPPCGVARFVCRGHRTNVSTVYDPTLVATSSPALIVSPFANFDTSALDDFVIIDASFDAFSAPGTVDLLFKNAILGESQTIRRGSCFQSTNTT